MPGLQAARKKSGSELPQSKAVGHFIMSPKFLCAGDNQVGWRAASWGGQERIGEVWRVKVTVCVETGPVVVLGWEMSEYEGGAAS